MLGKSLAILLNFRHLLIIKCLFLVYFFKIQFAVAFASFFKKVVLGHMHILLLEFVLFVHICPISRQQKKKKKDIYICFKTTELEILHSAVRTESCINSHVLILRIHLRAHAYISQHFSGGMCKLLCYHINSRVN